MHWLIQDNLFHEQGFQDLVQVLERLEIPHTLVQVLPGGAGTRPAVDVEGPVVVMGSLALTRYAKTRGWVPGAFFNDRFDFEVWREHLGAELLNADATVHRLAEVPERTGRFFLRPCLDGKAFTGKVLDWEEFARWREARLSSQEAGRLDANTRVALSAPASRVSPPTKWPSSCATAARSCDRLSTASSPMPRLNTRRPPSPKKPPTWHTYAFTSATRYTSSGGAVPMARATSWMKANSRGCSASVSRGPGGSKRSRRGHAAHPSRPAPARHSTVSSAWKRCVV